MTIPRLDASFTGTGDLTSALLLAWMSQHPTRLVHNMLQVIRTVHVRTPPSRYHRLPPPLHPPTSQAVCRTTLELGSSQGPDGKSKLPELQLIASRGAIMQPPQLEGIQAIPLKGLSLAGALGGQSEAAVPAQVAAANADAHSGTLAEK